MQEQPRTASSLGRLLPWIISATALAVYLATVSRWLTVQSLTVVSQVGGWDDNFPANAPVLYLLTRPLTWIPSGLLPIAGNLFTTLLAAASIWNLARTVQLFPQDRTHPQRIRGFSDGRCLDNRFAWVPPVFAAAFFALQLTAWEHATALSGEMLNLLFFSTAARALMEYRHSRNQRWLDAMALLVGVGITNDWAMIGFLPAFAAASLWIGGWEELRIQRILRLVLIGAAGLVLYLVTPILGAGRGGLPEPFWEALVALLKTQKNILLGIPKAIFLMLAAIMILPLAVAGLRWASPRGSGIERMATFGALTILKVVWFAGNVWMVYDGKFSPRGLVTTSGEFGALPLLTFHYCAALSLGYLAGYFIVLGTVKPDRQWSRSDLAGGFLHPALSWLVLASVVVVPASLLYRNLPALKQQNGVALSHLAAELFSPLPAKPALIVTDNLVLQALLDAQIRRSPNAPRHLIVNSSRAPEAAYRRHLLKLHGDVWPDLKDFAGSKAGVGDAFLRLFARAVEGGTAFTLNLTTSFVTEDSYVVPAGAIFSFRRYASGQVAPPPLTAQEQEAISRFWTSQKANLDGLVEVPAERSSIATAYAASFWAQAANAQGVQLQRSGQLDAAGNLFALARKLDSKNLSVPVNLLVNDALRNKRPVGPEAAKLIESFGVGIADVHGPIDEPRFLERLGAGVLELGDPLVRASAISFLRARELDPTSIDAAIGYARACVAANEPKLALEAHAVAMELARNGKPTTAQRSLLFRVEANARLRSGDLASAERILTAGLTEFPEDIPMLDLLSFAYMNANAGEKALPYVERILKLKPDDEVLLQRQGYLLLHLGRIDDAITTYDKILKRNPDDAIARMNRATLHLAGNQPDKAIEDFESVLERVPDAIDAQIGLAEAAFLKKDKATAIQRLEKVLSLITDTGPTQSNITARLAAIKAAP
jgi:tetratricopeptide (TPR) repeat protein